VSSRHHFLEPLLRAGDAAYCLVQERTGKVVAHHLELASDSRSRNRGLLGRSGLADGSALIIAPCNAVHTFFMRFTIDVIFADRQGNVVSLRPQLKPWRIGTGLRGFAAVEMTGGSITKMGLLLGDRLTVERLPDS
jgi:uncharacterized membrane protein (UPF0127 family)